MGGEGWSIGLREFRKNHLNEWIPQMNDKVIVLTTDQLIGTDLNIL